MRRALLPFLLPLLVGASWEQEQQGHLRRADLTYSFSHAPARELATVYEADLGTSDFTGHNLAASASAVTTTHGGGLVLTTDTLCSLVALRLPELLPQRTDGSRGAWLPVWRYTASSSVAGQPHAECTTPVVSGARVAWVSKQRNQLHAVDVDGDTPTPAPWSPLALPPQYFAQDAWTDFLSLLLVNNSVWVPSHAADPPGVLHVDLRTGAWVWAASNTTSTSATGGAAGSCGPPRESNKNPDRQAAIFIMDGVKNPLEYLRSDGFHVWTSTVEWASGQRQQHPTIVDLTGSRHCALVVKPGGGSMQMAAVKTISGIHCYNWPQKEITLDNAFTVNATWVSSAALLSDSADNPFPFLFVASRASSSQGALTSWIITPETAVLRDGYHIPSGAPDVAPIVLKRAFCGAETACKRHGLLYSPRAAMLEVADAWALAEGPVSSLDLNHWKDRSQLRIVGPFMAATVGGSALVSARATSSDPSPPAGTKYRLYLYGISHAQFPLPVPLPISASPSSAAMPSQDASPSQQARPAPAADNSLSAGATAAAVIASLSALGAAAGAFVWRRQLSDRLGPAFRRAVNASGGGGGSWGESLAARREVSAAIGNARTADLLSTGSGFAHTPGRGAGGYGAVH